jgi:hypothetical protein
MVIAIFSFVSCGVFDRPEIPFTSDEIVFFKQLDCYSLSIDSVKRDIEIARMAWKQYSKHASINIFSNKDSLTVKERDSLSNKIADFYSTLKIENMQFTDCTINYFQKKAVSFHESPYYFYLYDIEQENPVLKRKSYSLE